MYKIWPCVSNEVENGAIVRAPKHADGTSVRLVHVEYSEQEAASEKGICFSRATLHGPGDYLQRGIGEQALRNKGCGGDAEGEITMYRRV